MQKLAASLSSIRNETGSSLVMALAISLIMGIMVAGFIQIAGASTSQEVARFDEMKAFQAAESGMLLGSAWIKVPAHSSAANALSNGASMSDIIPSLVINGYIVRVAVQKGATDILISSTALSARRIGYDKTISWRVKLAKASSGTYGTAYVGGLNPTTGNTKGIRKAVFDGPVLSNGAIRFASTSSGNRPEFNARVAVYNIDPATGMAVSNSSYGTGHDGNDYTHGLLVSTGNPTTSAFDAIFNGAYDPTINRPTISFTPLNPTPIDVSASSNKSITFGATSSLSWYTYPNSADVPQTVYYDASVPQSLHVVGSMVSVSGRVKGQVVVYTDAGKSITVGDNLLYYGYTVPSNLSLADSSTNFGLGFASSNVIALHSGSSIIIDNSKVSTITAQLFAYKADSATINFTQDKHNSPVTVIGTYTVFAYWDDNQGNNGTPFIRYFDRRQLTAPGIGYISINDHGDTVNTLSVSSWAETNH